MVVSAYAGEGTPNQAELDQIVLQVVQECGHLLPSPTTTDVPSTQIELREAVARQACADPRIEYDAARALGYATADYLPDANETDVKVIYDLVHAYCGDSIGWLE